MRTRLSGACKDVAEAIERNERVWQRSLALRVRKAGAGSAGGKPLLTCLVKAAMYVGKGFSRQDPMNGSLAISDENGGDLAEFKRAWQFEREPLPYPDVHRDGSDQRRRFSEQMDTLHPAQ